MALVRLKGATQNLVGCGGRDAEPEIRESSVLGEFRIASDMTAASDHWVMHTHIGVQKGVDDCTDDCLVYLRLRHFIDHGWKKKISCEPESA